MDTLFSFALHSADGFTTEIFNWRGGDPTGLRFRATSTNVCFILTVCPKTRASRTRRLELASTPAYLFVTIKYDRKSQPIFESGSHQSTSLKPFVRRDYNLDDRKMAAPTLRCNWQPQLVLRGNINQRSE